MGRFKNCEKEMIDHIEHGIRLFVKYNHFESVEKVILNIGEGGAVQIFVMSKGFGHCLDLDRPDYDQTEEDRAERKEWVCEDEAGHTEFYEMYREKENFKVWERMAAEIGRKLGCKVVCMCE